MPLVISASQITETPPDTFIFQGLSTNNPAGIADISYLAGNMVDGVFTQKEVRNIHLEPARLIALFGRHPPLYGMLKAALYEEIAANEGQGTVT